VVVRSAQPAYVVPPPPPPKQRYRLRRWGFNMRLVAALMDEQNEGGGMGGLGFSVRVRPERHFALDFGLDMLGGRDYQGYRRSEAPFTISAMVYANPRSAVQFYMLGGIGWSHARVETDDASGHIEDYDYLGGQLGAGLEFRLSPPVALNLDLLGFVRGRTDGDARNNPEFTDRDTGQTTNTSGGGLLRAGLTFYW
jgi:opacity protein-like surface antigen